jgi:hypothetical protein
VVLFSFIHSFSLFHYLFQNGASKSAAKFSPPNLQRLRGGCAPPPPPPSTSSFRSPVVPTQYILDDSHNFDENPNFNDSFNVDDDDEHQNVATLQTQSSTGEKIKPLLDL